MPGTGISGGGVIGDGAGSGCRGASGTGGPGLGSGGCGISGPGVDAWIKVPAPSLRGTGNIRRRSRPARDHGRTLILCAAPITDPDHDRPP